MFLCKYLVSGYCCQNWLKCIHAPLNMEKCTYGAPAKDISRTKEEMHQDKAGKEYNIRSKN